MPGARLRQPPGSKISVRAQHFLLYVARSCVNPSSSQHSIDLCYAGSGRSVGWTGVLVLTNMRGAPWSEA